MIILSQDQLTEVYFSNDIPTGSSFLIYSEQMQSGKSYTINPYYYNDRYSISQFIINPSITGYTGLTLMSGLLPGRYTYKLMKNNDILDLGIMLIKDLPVQNPPSIVYPKDKQERIVYQKNK